MYNLILINGTELFFVFLQKVEKKFKCNSTVKGPHKHMKLSQITW